MAEFPAGRVRIERDGHITRLLLDYPERRNALSMPVRAGLIEGLEAALADQECRVIVLAGAGSIFCSGGDISSFAGITPVSGRLRMQYTHKIIRLIVKGEKPVIAAVEGHAIGAGLSLAAACDIVVAASDAIFACRFNRIGLCPDLGAAWSLPMRMGQGKARLLMLSGRTLDAAAAERQGLADLLAPPGGALQAAMVLANEIVLTAPLANGMLKALMINSHAAFEQMLTAETDTQGLLYSTGDFQEGRAAFLEKRKPVFRGA